MSCDDFWLKMNWTSWMRVTERTEGRGWSVVGADRQAVYIQQLLSKNCFCFLLTPNATSDKKTKQNTVDVTAPFPVWIRKQRSLSLWESNLKTIRSAHCVESVTMLPDRADECIRSLQPVAQRNKRAEQTNPMCLLRLHEWTWKCAAGGWGRVCLYNVSAKCVCVCVCIS